MLRGFLIVFVEVPDGNRVRINGEHETRRLYFVVPHEDFDSIEHGQDSLRSALHLQQREADRLPSQFKYHSVFFRVGQVFVHHGDGASRVQNVDEVFVGHF